MYGQDVGGARALVPVVRDLREDEQFTIKVFATSRAAAVFRRGGIQCDVVNPAPLSERAAREVIRKAAPALFVSDAGHCRDPSSARLIAACRRMGIQTIGLLDHWKNLDRFGEPDSRVDDQAPDVLGVMDPVSKILLAQLGLPAHRLTVVGHPHLQEIYAARHRILSAGRRTELRRNLGLPREALVILCCSELLHVHGARETCNGQCLPLFQTKLSGARLLDHLEGIAGRVSRNARRSCVVALRPHPFEMHGGGRQHSGIAWVLDDRMCSDVEAVALADVVVGKSAMPLIQAYFLGKPVLSLQLPCLMRATPPTRWGWCWDDSRTFAVVHSLSEVEMVLRRIAAGKWRPAPLTPEARAVVRGARGRVVRLIQSAAASTIRNRPSSSSEKICPRLH